MVVRRSLLGASQESSTWAIGPEAYSRSMNATSGRSPTQARAVALTCVGVSPSQYRRIEKSWGARSQTTLTSDWWRPRLTRLDETNRSCPSSPETIRSWIATTGGL